MSENRQSRQSATEDAVIRVVLELLESEGYDGVKLRAVASRARVSLATIYKLFGTREELIIAALARWMEANGYSGLQEPVPGMSFAEGQLWAFHRIFDPWQEHPRMLEAYCRARTVVGGRWLDMHGRAAVGPQVQQYFDQLDPEYAADVALILEYFTCHAFARVATGDLSVSELLPLLERVVHRVTANNEELAAGLQRPLPSSAHRVLEDT